MLGAIFGDITGSVYEFNNTNDYNFRLLSKWSKPTDDSYMTLAVAKALMETYGRDDETIRAAVVRNMQDIGRRYPHAGYGGMFARWLRQRNPQPYNSFGNGSAMRVSPAGWLYQTLEETLHAAKITAEVTHDHPEGIKGAQAIAAAIFLARAKADKDQIINYIANEFKYNLFRTLDEIRPNYSFYEICQKSVPEAIIAFYEGDDYEDVIRKAISLGGDSDTIACMAGAIAEAYYGMPEEYKEETLARLDRPMRDIVHEFRRFYRKHSGKPFDGWEDDIHMNDIDPFMRWNPMIEERIDAFHRDPEAENAVWSVLESIMLAMSQDAHVLIPVETPEAALKAFDPAKLQIGEEITLEEDLHWTLIHFNHEDGEISMPVFTSREKMYEGGLEGCSCISNFLDAYMEQVLEMEGVKGLIVNPGDSNFLLNKEIICAMLEQSRQQRIIQRTPGENASFIQPEHVPEGFTDVIAEFIRNNLDEVEKVWFTGIEDGEEKSWCFALKADTDDMEHIYDRIHTMIVMMKVNAPVDYMSSEDAPWPGARLIYERESR